VGTGRSWAGDLAQPLVCQLRKSQMNSSQLNKSRFIVGLILVVIAVLMFLFVKGDYSTTGAVGIAIIGLVSIAISRRK
jgi:hypothetical protein